MTLTSLKQPSNHLHTFAFCKQKAPQLRRLETMAKGAQHHYRFYF